VRFLHAARSCGANVTYLLANAQSTSDLQHHNSKTKERHTGTMSIPWRATRILLHDHRRRSLGGKHLLWRRISRCCVRAVRACRRNIVLWVWVVTSVLIGWNMLVPVPGVFVEQSIRRFCAGHDDHSEVSASKLHINRTKQTYVVSVILRRPTVLHKSFNSLADVVHKLPPRSVCLKIANH